MSMTIRCQISQEINNPKILKILVERLGWQQFNQPTEKLCTFIIPVDNRRYFVRFDTGTNSAFFDGDYRSAIQPQLDRMSGVDYNAAVAVHSLQEQGLDYTEGVNADGYPTFEAEIKEVSYA